MTEITNNYAGPLVIDGAEIATGQTVDIPAWDAIKDNGLYPLWLRDGVISEASQPEGKPQSVAIANVANRDNKRSSYRRSGRNSK